jgi:hypothetical protein
MTRWTALMFTAVMTAFAANAAWADSCETYAGSQVYTDQCGPGQEQKRPEAAPAQQQPQQGDSLRDKLRQSLSSGSNNQTSGNNTPQSAEQLNQRVLDARGRIDSALSDPSAPDSHQRYDAAMKDLRSAYHDAEQTFPDKASTFQQQEQNDAQSADSRASNVTWASPDTPPEPDQPKAPDNVMAQGNNVYVCDSAIGGNNPSCREISPSGECTGVTMSDGEPGWRDSTSTPCSPGDLDQRQAYLDAHPDEAAALKNTDPGFKMDAAGTDAAIKQLTAEPPRPLDDDTLKDWNAASANPKMPVADDAYTVTPVDLANLPAPGSSNDDDLDNAIDILNATSSMLGSLGRVSAPTVRTPTVRAPAPVFKAPTYTYHPQPTTNSTITGNTGN